MHSLFNAGLAGLAAAHAAHALWFDLDEHTCVTTRLREKDIAFKYEVKNADSVQISLEIRDVTHNDLLKRVKDLKDSDTIMFHVPEYDDYEFCFDSTDNSERSFYNTNPFTSISIEMKEDVQDAAAVEQATKKFVEGLEPIGEMLTHALQQALDLSLDYEFMRKREAEHRSTSENTHDRLLFFSLLSILVLLGVGVHQVYHLKRFFRKKKLI